MKAYCRDLGRMDYKTCWDLQQELFDAGVAAALHDRLSISHQIYLKIDCKNSQKQFVFPARRRTNYIILYIITRKRRNLNRNF